MMHAFACARLRARLRVLQELAEVEAEAKKTQTLKQSVVVMGNARRELNKATVNIEEVSRRRSSVHARCCGWWWCA